MDDNDVSYRQFPTRIQGPGRYLSEGVSTPMGTDHQGLRLGLFYSVCMYKEVCASLFIIFCLLRDSKLQSQYFQILISGLHLYPSQHPHPSLPKAPSVFQDPLDESNRQNIPRFREYLHVNEKSDGTLEYRIPPTCRKGQA